MILRYKSFNEKFGWQDVDDEIKNFIMEFYLDLVDEGIKLTIEEWWDDPRIREVPADPDKKDYRYSVEFECPREKDIYGGYEYNNGVSTINSMLKYGKMFYDSSITFENSTGAEIVNMRCTESRSFSVLFALPNPLIP